MAQLLRHAFQDLNLHRVWLRVLSDNEPAIHLYTKLGFIHEGRSRDVVFKNGKYADLLHMSILDKEYMAVFAEEIVSVPLEEMPLRQVHAG
jgi:RimJ/RimL family protein N-acetyltransferase